MSGLVIIAFRLLIEWAQISILPDGDFENYEQLDPLWIFLLPFIGAVILGFLFQWIDKKYRSVGVVHTIERLDYHQGQLPLVNAFIQFIGAAISIISGHSVGREGPSIHLGAASGSFIGQSLKLSNNSLRILVGCGIASAIASSFNTPLAGVIFTIEVIMLEYALFSMLPILLAAVTATVMSRLVFGDEALFSGTESALTNSTEYIWVIVTGIIIGLLAASYIRLLVFFSKFVSHWPIALRMSLAGVITGGCAVVAPEIMSIGYDTIAQASMGNIAIAALIIIVLVKLLATTASLGLGIPGGLIGPTLFIGATAGAAIGALGVDMAPEHVHSAGIYALIGMGAMMGATIHAPLAALLAVFELTQNPNVILPGMLAIFVAHIIVSEAFKQRAVFDQLLKIRGLDHSDNPITRSLRHVPIVQIMDQDFALVDTMITNDATRLLLESPPRWILVKKQDQLVSLFPTADLQAYAIQTDTTDINLLEMPANRLDAAPLSVQATLQDAYRLIENNDIEALYVTDMSKSKNIIGIVNRDDIENYKPIGRIKRA